MMNTQYASNDEIGITFKAKTFRAHLMARVVRQTRKELTVDRLPAEIREVIPFNTIKAIALLAD